MTKTKTITITITTKIIKHDNIYNENNHSENNDDNDNDDNSYNNNDNHELNNDNGVTTTAIVRKKTTTNTMQITMIERFSNDCQKTKTNAISPTNHDRRKQHDEPITIPRNYLKLFQSAGKITRTWRDWFWFCFSLAEKLALVF